MAAGMSLVPKYGGSTHNTIYNELVFKPDPHVLIAGQLLNLGRRALHEYASKRGFDGDPLVKVMNAAGTAWVDSLGLDRTTVNTNAQQIDDHLGALRISPSALSSALLISRCNSKDQGC